MMKSEQLLAFVREKPVMLWGSSDHLFTSLIAFIAGVRVAAGPELVPLDFYKFVAKRLGEEPSGGQGWETFIRKHTNSEREAFELFFKLRDEYERARA